MSQQGDKLHIEYFTCGGPAFTVSLCDSELHFEWFSIGVYAPADKQIQLSPDWLAWQSFWTQVRLVGAWHWDNKYDGHALDGEQWHIKLAHDDKQIESRLINAYPPKGASTPSEAFKHFLQAIGELLGDKNFINYWYHNEPGGVYGTNE